MTSLTGSRSAALYRRAVEVIPGGVNSPVRAMRAIGRDPPRGGAAGGGAPARGTSFGAPTAAEVELAVEVRRRMEGVDMLRMTSSGTEATMTAVRLARAATGRERVLKFAG